MALLIFPPEKLTPQLKALLDPSLRESVASSVNEAILASQGDERHARLKKLMKLRCYTEQKAREAKLDIPASIDLGTGGADEGSEGEPMVT